MPEEAREPENPTPQPSVEATKEPAPSAPFRPSSDRDSESSPLNRVAERLEKIQKEMAELRNEFQELRAARNPLPGATQAGEGKEKDPSRSPRDAVRPRTSPEIAERTTAAQAREALRRLHDAPRELGGPALRGERRLEEGFGRLQHDRKRFFDQSARVAKDEARLQQDQRLHPERVAKDEEKLHQDRQRLRFDREIVHRDARSLGRDASRFGAEHPGLRKEAEIVAKEALREDRALSAVPGDARHRERAHPASSARQAMEALREKAKGEHSPTRWIVTQAGRHVQIFESTRRELLSLHQKYAEDLARAQRDRALHPEEWKRLWEDRKKIARDRAAIRGDEQTLAREARVVGHLAREIGREDPSLRGEARNLRDRIQAEERDAQRFRPSVSSRDARGGGRDR